MTTREVRVHRADGVTRDDAVQSVVIRIDQEQQTPEYSSPEYVTATAAMFKADGKALADALFDACPGGTISELIAELLERRACHFRVRFPQEANR
ncbi:hypothetical protein Ade02nite_19260 [Paractinoplanes deccanensis]|uniref:MmgE/PrpD family protein n=1 Tax=Paractinoplanes deccanensis TaxID=113561 RepID=A0ABQ3XZX1_9ACTN|nr:hypothetical protein [Actinoplanes deccanensis]GID73285.1 hypothetical protein Ade02nite_19260 [Actinoplanes deccanensis]